MRRRTRSRGTTDLLSGGGFTARQVTALVVAILLAVVLVPVGAQAAQVVSAIITDPGGTNKARVDASGNLQIGGEVTVGNQAASPVPVAPQGTTMVEGSVAAQPALAGTSLADTISLDTIHPGGSSSDKFFGQNFSENQRVAVTSLTFDNEIQVGAATVGILIQALHPISGESSMWDRRPRCIWTSPIHSSRRPPPAAIGACGRTSSTVASRSPSPPWDIWSRLRELTGRAPGPAKYGGLAPGRAGAEVQGLLIDPAVARWDCPRFG